MHLLDLMKYNGFTMRKIVYLLGYAIAFAVIFYASNAFAATPQEILNQSLANYDAKTGMSMSGEMKMDMVENIWDKDYVNGPEKASFAISFAQRSLPMTEDGYQDGEGYFKISKLYIEDGDEVLTISDPLKIFWRVVAPNMYIKIDRLPGSIKEQLALIGADLSPITQRWFEFEAPKENVLETLMPAAALGGTNPSDELSSMFKNLGDKNILQITRIEKTYKNAAGDEIVRARVGINKNILYKEYQQELNEAYKITNYKERQEAIKEAREDYEKNLKDARALHMAANINTTKQRLERIELGLTQAEDKEDCTWNADWTDRTCKVVGTTTVKFNAGIWISDANHNRVLTPYNAMTLDEAESFFEEALGL